MSNRRRLVRGVALAGAMLSTACAGHLVPPAEGGPPWLELRSQHFVVRTDLDRATARERAGEFEAFWNVLYEHGFGASDPPAGAVHVVCLRSMGEYQALGFEDTSGHYTNPAGHGLLDPTVVMPCDERGTQETLQHELTHRFVGHHFPNAPIWVNEGLAEFYEYAEMGTDTLTLGLGPETRIILGQRILPPAPSMLRSLDRATFYGGSSNDPHTEAYQNYLFAWGLVHSALLGGSELRQRFDQFLAGLVDRGPEKAWQSAFDANAEARLTAEYESLFREESILTARLRFTPARPPTMTERSLSAAEIHALWAKERSWRGSQLTEAAADLERAVALDPGLIAARAVGAEFELDRGRPAVARAHLQAAVIRNPTDERALAAFLVHVIEAHDQATPDSERALLADRLARVATTTLAYRALSEYALASSDPNRAWTLAAKAILTDSSCFRCYDVLAAAYFAGGEATKAVRAQRIGINLRPDNAPVDEARKRLAEYQAAENERGL